MWEYTEESETMKAYDEMLRSYRGSMGLSADMDCSKGIDLSVPNGTVVHEDGEGIKRSTSII